MSVIAFKDKGHLLPDAFIQRALKGTVAVGYACKDTNALAIDWVPDVNEDHIKDLKETQEAFKDDAMMFIFMDKVLKQEEQPYYILSDANKDGLLAAFIDGSFHNYVPKDDTTHTNIWWMVEKYIRPKMAKLSKLSSSSSIANLIDDTEKTDLEGLGAEEGGTLVLFDSTGEEMCFTNSEHYRKFSWGYASNHLDILERTGHEEKADAAPVEETKMQRLKRLKAEKAAATAAAPIIGAAATSETSSEPAARTEAAAYPADTGKEYIMISPPDEITSNNKLKEWYQKTSMKYNGYSHLPKEWKDRVPLQCIKPVGLKPSVVKDFKEIPKEAIAKMASKPIASVTPIQQPDKKDQGRGVVEEVLPIINPKTKEAVEDDFGSKVLDKNSMEMPIKPSELQEQEKRFPTFWEATGISRDVTDRYTDEMRRDLCRKYPDAAAILLKNYMIDSIVNRPKDELEDEDATDTSGTGTVVESKMDRLRRLKAEKKVAM